VYGADGYGIISTGGSTSAASYATVTIGGAFLGFTWSSNTADTRGLYANATSATRVAGQDYCNTQCYPYAASSTAFTIDVNVTDGNTHQFSLYLMQFGDSGAVQDVILVSDGASGRPLLLNAFNNFNNSSPIAGGGSNEPASTGPIYARWNISGHVKFTLYYPQNDADSATFSAWFFDPVTRAQVTSSNNATYVTTDTLTQGNWTPGSGGDGYFIANGIATVRPSYESDLWYGIGLNTWTSSTTDVRAPWTSTGMTTRAASQYVAGAFGVNLIYSGTVAHTTDFYFLDWSGTGYSTTAYVADGATGRIYDTRTISGYTGGTHAAWNLTGSNLVFLLGNNLGNASFSGIFFGTRVPYLTLVASVSPTGAQAPGTVLTYAGAIANGGAVSSQTNVAVAPIPANTDFQLGSVTSTLTGTNLTSPTIAYSNNSGSTYTYTPTSTGGGAPSGYDRTVTNIRWTFGGTLSQGAGAANASVGFNVRIQ
jgi:hypothetical protein